MPNLSAGSRILLGLLRFSLGWLFFYAGWTKVINPEWTAKGYLSNTQQFAGFYNTLTHPTIMPIIDALNAWGLTLLGVSLMLGIGIRLSAPLGALLMLLYYLPLGFPHPSAHSYIVDEHIVYAFALLALAALRAGRVSDGALAEKFWNLPALRRFGNLGDIFD